MLRRCRPRRFKWPPVAVLRSCFANDLPIRSPRTSGIFVKSGLKEVAHQSSEILTANQLSTARLVSTSFRQPSKAQRGAGPESIRWRSPRLRPIPDRLYFFRARHTKWLR